MNILIVGGHAKANFLTKSLKESGHNVTIVNKDKEWCKIMAHSHGIVGVYGDGTKPFVLKDAGAIEMDTVIALCNTDSANLVICEVAKKQFNVKNTFAVVNDPQHIKIFKKLGVDKVISSTEILSDMIEFEAVIDNLINYLPMENEKIILSEFYIDARSPVAEKMIKDINLPNEAIIAYIIRNDNLVICAEGDCELKISDKVIVLSSSKDFDKITSLFYWRK
ncbi:MAG: TrkA family potassium uptake protein [Firmicutes bacterium]|nr:TrkA family potassium uptake protein [Bacillota bacterium]